MRRLQQQRPEEGALHHGAYPAVSQQARYALRILRREWVTDLLEALAAGPRRYNELLQLLQASRDGVNDPRQDAEQRHIQDSVLNRVLAKLRAEGLVLRDRESVFPYHTTYFITAAGQELLESLIPLARWVERQQNSSHTSHPPGESS
ncbi:winged helix-turn-helix transcriptional regulator [Streptomyces sp. NBC_00079]|uniref:winged helix-turn-helix transcriptional regulator n=1 Tax=Streptomyces sp. NBC_00079 TaxID=2975644 RepID=UPI00386DE454